MPELPEVETIVRGLSPHVRRRVIERARIHRTDVVVGSAGRFRRLVADRTVEEIGRRGKNVVLHLESGLHLVVNLGMTGRLLFASGPSRGRASPPTDATHVAVTLFLREPDDERGERILYDDVRRFGRLRLLDGDEWDRWSGSLGPEPLDDPFTAAWLQEHLSRSASPIRSWLLDQRRVAGIGNIYANEALYEAKVHPGREARSLTPLQVRRLHASIRSVLERAVQHRGTTFSDYRDPEGNEGSFGPRLAIYGRAHQPCRRCGTPIRRIVFGGRSAFLCPGCQPE